VRPPPRRDTIRRRAAFRVLLALPLLLLSGASGPSDPRSEDGAFAPAGRWYVAGGSASRTARSLSDPVRRTPETAWTQRLSGTLESEPLVWDGRVVVAVRQSSLRRHVQVLDLATGRVEVSQPFPATRPLAPAIWGDVLAIHPAPERVELFRITGHRLLSMRTFRASARSGATLSDPLLFEEELYLRDGGELVRWDLDAHEEVWRAVPEGDFRGTPSLRGGLVYGVWYEPVGNAHLVSLRRSDGALVDHVPAGHHGGEIPAEGAELELVVLDREVFVRYPLPVLGSSGRRLDAVGLPRVDGRLRGNATVHAFAGDPVDWRDGWIVREGGSAASWIASERRGDSIQSVVLADPANHAELLDVDAASWSGDVLQLGPVAVDGADFSVLWRGPTPALRPVPTGAGILIATKPDELRLLREPLAHPTAAEREAGTIATALRTESAEALASLALQALRAGDLALIQRLIERAEERGAESRALDSARAACDRMAAGSRPPVPDPGRIAAIEREERATLARPALELVARARATRDEELRLALLRRVLEPGDAAAAEVEPGARAEAAALVRSLLPPGIAVVEPFDAASWLEFLVARSRTPLAVRLPPPSGRPPGASDDPRGAILARETAAWRTDLVGYESERLFVVTPPGRPGAVAHALAVGELACDVLEEVFDVRGPRADDEPLTVLLYESQEEYVRESQRERSLPEVARGWMAGHYSPAENLSRMFVPADDASLARMLEVYAHELTHHWLAARAPFRSSRSGGNANPELPGYWIAEGFATLVEELDLDPERGTWSVDNPRAESLDTLANVRDDQLLAWDVVFGASKRSFGELSAEPDREVALAWRLGARAAKSEVHLFYAQAGAACHWLFHGADEAERARLLAYLRAWYEGDAEALDVRRAFGLTPEELGRRTLEFARAQAW